MPAGGIQGKRYYLGKRAAIVLLAAIRKVLTWRRGLGLNTIFLGSCFFFYFKANRRRRDLKRYESASHYPKLKSTQVCPLGSDVNVASNIIADSSWISERFTIRVSARNWCLEVPRVVTDDHSSNTAHIPGTGEQHT